RRLERLPGLGARTVAGERLLRPLELADLKKIDVEAYLVDEELVEVDRLRGEPDRVDAASLRDPHALAATGGKSQRTVRVLVGVAPDRQLGAERRQHLADLGGPRESDARGTQPHEDPPHVGRLDGSIEDLDLVDQISERHSLRRESQQP